MANEDRGHEVVGESLTDNGQMDVRGEPSRQEISVELIERFGI